MTSSKSAAAVAAALSPAVRTRGPRHSVLFFAFAFAVIADPVSSVAYAIEAALRALHGDLALLLPTMSLVIGLVVVVTANYWQLVRRFPKGGGALPRQAGLSARASRSCPSGRWWSTSC